MIKFRVICKPNGPSQMQTRLTGHTCIKYYSIKVLSLQYWCSE